MNAHDKRHRPILQGIARRGMPGGHAKILIAVADEDGAGQGHAMTGMKQWIETYRRSAFIPQDLTAIWYRAR